ncbi:MAG: filamentous hemagglutinin N-terminal domain-containing protein [Rhodocyclales bacterium]|nr:filamentous hemagglutinin N-terminal domain-containing protein [Rhodocyclales bacterium]
MFNHATMNRAYRLVWSNVRDTWIAVPEFARAMGKSASMVAAGALLVTGMTGHAMAQAVGLNALPTGGQVVSGQVAIAVASARMDVNQATRSAIVNWNSFNIGSQAQVSFNQPDPSSVILNRVLGGNGSTILGQMTANGNVFLVDPAGIIFAPGARVDVGGLVASSLGISDSNFLAGKYQFEKAGTAGAVTNQGAITTANGGYVALIAPQVANQGTILASAGSVGLAAGDSVNLDFDHDGLLSFQVNLPAAAARADNKGTIIADGGRVVMNVQAKDALLSTVLNNEGIVRARSVEARNGEIWLGGGASGVVRVSGTLDASGVERQTSGGVVKVLGENVGLFDHAKIDVSGVGAGGTALIGGNWQGKGPEQNATATYVGKDATINANAVGVGDGGKVVVWADKLTSFLGSIFAKGGASGGNGGTVEVSGKQHLSFNGSVDTTAANGTRGTLLLDPTDVNIVTGGTENLIGTTNDDADPNTYAFNESDGVSPSNISPTTIVTLLDSSDVTIQATNDITVSNDIDASANTASKGLTLTANNAIFLNANITLKQGATSFLTLTSDADTSGAGTITVSGDRTVTVLDGAINFSGITHAPTGGGAESLTLNAGTGTLTMGAIYGSGAVADATGLTTLTISNSGAANFNGAINITGALTQTNAATGTTTFANTVSVGSADLKGVAYALNNSFASHPHQRQHRRHRRHRHREPDTAGRHRQPRLHRRAGHGGGQQPAQRHGDQCRGDQLQQHGEHHRRPDADQCRDRDHHLRQHRERRQRRPEGRGLRPQQQLRLGRHHDHRQHGHAEQERHRQHQLDGGLQRHRRQPGDRRRRQPDLVHRRRRRQHPHQRQHRRHRRRSGGEPDGECRDGVGDVYGQPGRRQFIVELYSQRWINLAWNDWCR